MARQTFSILFYMYVCVLYEYACMMYVGSTFADLAFCDPVNDKFDSMYNSLFSYVVD